MIKSKNTRLEFRGGIIGLLLPFLFLFIGIMWLSFRGRALPAAFWVPTIFALFLALLLAKTPSKCAEAIIQGMASELVAIMFLAWFLAGIIAQLLKTTGLIQGLVWAGVSIGLKGALFPLITFAIGCLVSTAIGTVFGSIITLGPILFPVGVALGANPQAMIGAIVCGAYFGDNIAPVSDTTIASAYTMGTDVPSVVRTRLKYALIAAFIASLLYILFGAGEALSTPNTSLVENLNPKGLIMLIVPIVLIFLMFRGVHMVVSLMLTGASGIILAVASGLLPPENIIIIDMNSFSVGGVIPDGIKELIDVAVFAILLMGLVNLLERGGFLEAMVKKVNKYTTTPRRAELTIILITIIMNILIVASTIVIIMLGPFIRRITHSQKITQERRANILDAVSMGVMCVLPFSFGPLLAYILATKSSPEIHFSLISTIPYMFHGWALLGVMIFAVITGWGRNFMDKKSFEIECKKLDPNSYRS